MLNNYTPIKAKDINIDDIFYEIEYGEKMTFKAISQPIREDGQWRWKGLDLNTNIKVDFLQTEGYEYYGPKLYQ